MNWFFEDSGQLKVARQVSEAPASLQLELGSGRRLKVKRAQCLLAFSEPDLEGFFQQAQGKANELDADFLWQCAPAEEFAFQDFAKDVFGSEGGSALDQASLLLALHAAPVYFQRKGKGLFRAMPEESLKAALAGIERRRLAAERQAQMKQQLLDGQLPEALEALGLDLLIRPDKQSVEYKALEQAAFECQVSLEQLALQRGLLPSAYSLHRARFMAQGLHHAANDAPANSQQAIADCRGRRDDLLASLPLASSPAYSLDDAATTEVDDALSYEALPSGGFRVGVHIAAPGLAIEPGSLLGQWARERASTVYFPGEKLTMLPAEVIDVYSLNEGRENPCLSLYLEFDDQGQRTGVTTRIEKVFIAKNLRHDPWPDLLQQWSGLAPLLEQASRLRAQREQVRGRPEPTGRVDFSVQVQWDEKLESATAKQLGQGQPEIRLRPRDNEIDRLVSEWMIATNVAWGETLALAHLPGIYRCQSMGRVRMQTGPGPHQGMGVSHYAWSTSPLRRFSDLMNQWQVLAALGHRRPAYKPNDTELFADLAHFEACYDRYGEFQNQMERYWSLRWLGMEQGLATESWAAAQRPVAAEPLIEEGRLGREGLVRLARLPLTCRVPSWSHLPAGTEVTLEVIGADALSCELEVRGLQAQTPDTPLQLAVLGSPIAHSRSPAIHAAFAQELGLAVSYTAIDTPSAELRARLQALHSQGYAGLNLTVPLKEEVYALALTEGWPMSERAQKAQAINTLIRDSSGWRADNTDGLGLVRDLLRHLQVENLAGHRMLLIGAGGAARGVVLPLLQAGLDQLVIANRSPEKAHALVDTFTKAYLTAGNGEAAQLNIAGRAVDAPVPVLHALSLEALAQPLAIDPPTLVVNASASSLQQAVLTLHPSLFEQTRLALDMMYGPAAEHFLGLAQSAGVGLTLDGLGMLVEQAAVAFELWTGESPSTEPVLTLFKSQAPQ